MPQISVSAHFVKPGETAEDQVQWTTRNSEIRDAKGQPVFQMNAVEAPAEWDQLAVDIAASKYFRKAGVPGKGHETSVRQLVHRVAHTIRTEGERQGYFDAKNAETFEQELKHLLLNQKTAFNSPVFFNCGLFAEYGIRGENDIYQKPQASACFIQSIEDSLQSIYELARNEAFIFKYGSGTGTNFSPLRGRDERLAGGGTSSGLMGFLELLDKGAAVTKSGGITRRAAKMVCLDMDHPEIEEFITWKMREEKKVKALVEAGYPADFNGEAYRTVSGQNSNNSIRVSDAFMQAALEGSAWSTVERTTGKKSKSYSAAEMLRLAADSAWACADPGIQYHDTIQGWHTCATTGPIVASNPCSEFLFLNDTACNLSSLNLVKFVQGESKGQSIDILALRQAVRIMFLAQEILVDFSSYPTPKIAENSHRFRPLGLGYTNLGSWLLRLGIPYDSASGRTRAAALTALVTGWCYELSGEVAELKGPFEGYDENRGSMLQVMRRHRQAVEDVEWSELSRQEIRQIASQLWDQVIRLGEKHGFRNSQATAIAPTGTISFLMGCDTTGIEPEFSLVKEKHLAGGGMLRLINQSVASGLKTLGYPKATSDKILKYIDEHGSPLGCPDLDPQHLDVFDCAMGTRAIGVEGHLKMLAAVQPFVSGGISKTVNLSENVTPKDIESVFISAWKMGIKSVAVFRDGSKLSQPLQTKTHTKPVFPHCPVCGYTTVLKANCYHCENCGHTLGCG